MDPVPICFDGSRSPSCPFGTDCNSEAESDERFEVKGWDQRRDEEALIYRIPNHVNPDLPHEKGITASEFRAAYQQLCDLGRLTTAWFKENLPRCYAEGACNFTTVGGLFVLLDLAVRGERGEYLRKHARD